MPPRPSARQSADRCAATIKMRGQRRGPVQARSIGAAFDAGSSLLLPLLGINLSDEEATELDSSAVGSASPHQINFEERFAIHLASPPSLETMRQTNTEMTTASEDNIRTAGLSRESIPLPRPRKPR